MSLRPSYVVERVAYGSTNRWRLMHFPSGRSIGTILSHYPTKRQAECAARFLAGWCADVVIVPTKKASHHD